MFPEILSIFRFYVVLPQLFVCIVLPPRSAGFAIRQSGNIPADCKSAGTEKSAGSGYGNVTFGTSTQFATSGFISISSAENKI